MEELAPSGERKGGTRGFSAVVQRSIAHDKQDADHADRCIKDCVF